MALFRILLWALCAAPMVDLAWRTVTADLGSNPQEALLRGTGTWCLVMLLVTLGVTPARRMLDWGELLVVRRMLGLWTFAWALIHLLCFWAFEHDFVWLALLADGLRRPFVSVGIVGFVILAALALTSHKRAMRALGSRWKKLHRLIYVAAVLACIHFILHRAGKNNLADPAIASVVFVGLMLLRTRLMSRRAGGIQKV